MASTGPIGSRTAFFRSDMKRLLGFPIALCLATACATAPTPPASPSPTAPPILGPHEGEVVTARVERLERAAMVDTLDDGSVAISDVVWFGIELPVHFDTMLSATSSGHPHVGGRPLLLGSVVTFVLPRNWRNRELSLGDLEGLAFRP